jgi:hypothetical protein
VVHLITWLVPSSCLLCSQFCSSGHNLCSLLNFGWWVGYLVGSKLLLLPLLPLSCPAGVNEDCWCLPDQLDHHRLLLLSSSSSSNGHMVFKQQLPQQLGVAPLALASRHWFGVAAAATSAVS